MKALYGHGAERNSRGRAICRDRELICYLSSVMERRGGTCCPLPRAWLAFKQGDLLSSRVEGGSLQGVKLSVPS